MKALLLGLVLLSSCRGGAGAASPHPDPSCTDEAYEAMAADCETDAAACIVAGGAESLCGALCDERADDWRERCQ